MIRKRRPEKLTCGLCRGEYKARFVWTITLDDGPKVRVCAACRVLWYRPEAFDTPTLLEAALSIATAGAA